MMLDRIHGREAVPASTGWNVAKTAGQMVLFWSLFLGVIPVVVWYAEGRLGLAGWRVPSPAAWWSGVALFALGGTLGLSSAWVMAVRGRGTPLPADCARELVIAGPYRYVRNPMAVAGLGQGVAVGLLLGSPAVIAYALVGAPIWHWFVRPWEEADLERRFGAPYRRYRAAVRCWLPRLSGYDDTRTAA
ncbi:MAG: isoprenylcysteine carboxylmethyltransferase family protein [Gemmataceae bacterium]